MPHVDDGTLHALLDGALRAESPERAAEIEAHVAACPDCRARLAAAEEVRGEATGILDAAAADDSVAVPDFSEVVRRAAGGTAPDSPPRRLRRQARWTRGVAWAASLVLALGTGYLIRDLAGPTLEDRPRQPRSENVEAAPGAPPTTAPSSEMDAAASPSETPDGESGVPVEQSAPAADPPATDRTPPAPTPEPERAAGAVPPQVSAEDRRRDENAGAENARAADTGAADVRAADTGAEDDRAKAARAEAVEEERLEGLRASSADGLRSAFQDTSARWSSVTVAEARSALDGPLYLLPRAELVEIYLLVEEPRTHVLTLQRLQTGVPVQVVQWRGDEGDLAVEEDAAEPSPAGDPGLSRRMGLPHAALPDANVARVVRDDYVLELTGSLPAALLSVLGETADPAR